MTELFNNKKLETMEERFTAIRMSMLYKFIYSEITDDLNIKCGNLHTLRGSNNMNIQRPYSRTLLRATSFLPRAITEWNTLPEEKIMTADHSHFMKKIRSNQILAPAIYASKILLSRFFH